jgi:hypothetical protein
LIIAIIVLGLAAWGAELRRRSTFYRARASWHLQEERKSENNFATIASCGSWGTDPDGRPRQQRLLATCRKTTDYHSEMREKYEYAASHPWECIPADARAPAED